MPVHCSIQEFTAMFSVPVRSQALSRAIGRWMWTSLVYNWGAVYLTVGQDPHSSLEPRTECHVLSSLLYVSYSMWSRCQEQGGVSGNHSPLWWVSLWGGWHFLGCLLQGGRFLQSVPFSSLL